MKTTRITTPFSMSPILQPLQWVSRNAPSAAVLITLGVALFATQRADALIQTGHGNQPVPDPGWPGGAPAVANLENRVGWAKGPPLGGGQWTFFYRGSQTDLQNALEAFVAIKANRLEVVLHEGAATSPFRSGGGDDTQNASSDWSFEVWVPESWNRLYNDPHSFFSAAHLVAGFTFLLCHRGIIGVRSGLALSVFGATSIVRRAVKRP